MHSMEGYLEAYRLASGRGKRSADSFDDAASELKDDRAAGGFGERISVIGSSAFAADFDHSPIPL